MYPQWTNRLYVLLCNKDYPEIKNEYHWVKIMTNRFWSENGKWYGY